MQYSPDRVVGERGQCSMSNNGSNGGFSTIAEEKSPLVQLTKETIISLDYVSNSLINIALVLDNNHHRERTPQHLQRRRTSTRRTWRTAWRTGSARMTRSRWTGGPSTSPLLTLWSRLETCETWRWKVNQEGVANRAESLMEQPLLGTDVTARRKSGQVTNIADCCIKIFFKC